MIIVTDLNTGMPVYINPDEVAACSPHFNQKDYPGYVVYLKNADHAGFAICRVSTEDAALIFMEQQTK